MDIIERYTAEYQKQMLKLAPAINEIAKYVPSRRKRKLHTGLYGYSRSMGGVTFPRAIKFTAALYSLGLPPELLGLNALTREDRNFLKGVYVNFEKDIAAAVRYLNPDTGFVPEELKETLKELQSRYGCDEKHKEITGSIAKAIQENSTYGLETQTVLAAKLRKFLG
jgi:phosphoenolpyruvate carboxylase